MQQCLAALSLSSSVALAQDGISYDAARVAAQANNPGNKSTELAAVAAREQAAALDNLYRPTVTASASAIAYRKTLAVDLIGVKDKVETDISRFLDDLPGQFQPELSALVSAVAGRIEGALPDLLSPIPDGLSYPAKNVIVRPSLNAVLPIYTDGALQAVEDGAQAGVTLARGRQQISAAAQDVSLAQRYFGFQLARKLVQSAE